jgi:outer membrane protein assembly factor BamB
MKGCGKFGIGLVMATAVVAAFAPLGTGVRATGTGDWPMFADGPAHDAVNRAETTLTVSNVSSLHVAHTYPAWRPTMANTVYAVVVGNLAYSVIPATYTVNTLIAAFSLPSGSRAWHHQISSHNNTWNYVPAVGNGILYIGGDSQMAAYNAVSGALVWSTPVPLNSEFNEVSVANGMVYADTYRGGTVYAFNERNGHIVWSVVPPGCCLTGAVTVSGGVAYIPQTKKLFAYNATTGALLFAKADAGEADTVAVSGGVVFVQSIDGTTGGHLQAFNATSGALLWTVATEPGNIFSSLTPAVDGSTVVVGTMRYLIAFAASTGSRVWTYDTGTIATGFLPPTLANGVVYAGSLSNGLQAVKESTGAVLYTNGSDCSSAIVSHGEVFAACGGPAGESVWSL